MSFIPTRPPTTYVNKQRNQRVRKGNVLQLYKVGQKPVIHWSLCTTCIPQDRFATGHRGIGVDGRLVWSVVVGLAFGLAPAGLGLAFGLAPPGLGLAFGLAPPGLGLALGLALAAGLAIGLAVAAGLLLAIVHGVLPIAEVELVGMAYAPCCLVQSPGAATVPPSLQCSDAANPQRGH